MSDNLPVLLKRRLQAQVIGPIHAEMVAELGEDIRHWIGVYRRFYAFYFSSAHHFDEHLYAWCLRQLRPSPVFEPSS